MFGSLRYSEDHMLPVKAAYGERLDNDAAAELQSIIRRLDEDRIVKSLSAAKDVQSGTCTHSKVQGHLPSCKGETRCCMAALELIVRWRCQAVTLCL